MVILSSIVKLQAPVYGICLVIFISRICALGICQSHSQSGINKVLWKMIVSYLVTIMYNKQGFKTWCRTLQQL